MRRALPVALLLPLALGALPSPARAAPPPSPLLHEPIPADPREDLAMHVSLDGNLPAALQTPSGVVSAPDPRAMPAASDRAYSARGDFGVFQPDRDTRRPDVAPYDDPFTPATAPFKRLEAFDAVREDYQLYVRDTRLVVLPGTSAPTAAEEAFYADLVVDVAPGVSVRIPSVAPGARMLRGRLGVGGEELPFRILRDGADQWWLQVTGGRAPVRARLVQEVVAPRAAFGGDLGDPAWSELPGVVPLPASVARDAAKVQAAIGVSRAMRPREAIARLVAYHRGFTDSPEPPTGHGNIYLDLALSRRGVCRHRAFAFLVTAQSLGIPTRMVANEAHAWVEVHDGKQWRLIDLGGAGQMRPPPGGTSADRVPYRPPVDAFAWPRDARRAGDMVAEARAAAGPQAPGSAVAATPASPATSGRDPASRDDRAGSVVTLAVDDADPHRGAPLRVRGGVVADGAPCANVSVEVWLHDPVSPRALLLGRLATDRAGAFSGAIVVPTSTPLGDYDVSARTPGDARCGAASSR